MSKVQDVLSRKADVENRKGNWDKANRQAIDTIQKGVEASIADENKRLQNNGEKELDYYEKQKMLREAEKSMGL